MTVRTIIQTIAVAFVALATTTVHSYAKCKAIHSKPSKPITVGVETGKMLSFVPEPGFKSRSYNVYHSDNKSIFLRRSLGNHFKVQTGITCACTPIRYVQARNVRLAATQYHMSLPVSIQYYFASPHSRLRPYCGAGVQYNCPAYLSSGNTTAADQAFQTTGLLPATQRISIVFTQGMVFEVNTKIQITQSIHVIPTISDKAIGIDIGIGFTIP